MAPDGIQRTGYQFAGDTWSSFGLSTLLTSVISKMFLSFSSIFSGADLSAGVHGKGKSLREKQNFKSFATSRCRHSFPVDGTNRA